LLTGCFFLFVSSASATKRFERIYFKAFAFLPVIAGGIFLIPFFGFVLLLSLAGQLTQPVDQIYYQDDRLRVQSTFVGVLGTSRIDVFENCFLFEKHWYRSDFSGYGYKTVKVNYDADSTRVHFFLEGYDSIEHKVLSFKKLRKQP